MANINFESKALEDIQVKIAQGVIKGITPYVEEAVVMGISEHWEDIFKAVLAANPAPSVVSNDKLVTDLHARVQELEAMLIGTVCELPQGPVETSKEEDLSKVEEATANALKQVQERPMSMMDEVKEPMTKEEESLFTDGENEDLFESILHEDTLLDEDQAPVVQEPVVIDDASNPFAGIDVSDLGDDLVENEPQSNVFADAGESLESAEDTSLFSSAPELPEEPEAPALPMGSDTPVSTPAMPMGVSLGKNAVTVAVYNVMGKEVEMVRENASIKNSTTGHVRSDAFKLHNLMLKGSPKIKPVTQEEVNSHFEGKLYTQLIREWGLEIAAANNIKTLYGDAGAGILIAKLANEDGNIIAPPLRVRNEEERTATESAFRSMRSDEATRKQVIAFVNSYKNTLVWNPANFTGNRELSNEERIYFGYALLYARLKLAWANVTGKPVCVFPEVKKYQLSKEVVSKALS